MAGFFLNEHISGSWKGYDKMQYKHFISLSYRLIYISYTV